MGPRFLANSNAVIDYTGGLLPTPAALRFDAVVNEEFNISIVTRIEALGFNGPSEQMQALEEFLNLATLFYVDDAVAARAIALRKTYKKLKLGDAIIAATALVFGFTLLTRNTDDFKNIAELVIVNPHEMI